MRIQILFQFKSDPEPVAITGIEDGVTDLLIPVSGDFVTHKDVKGRPFTGRVAERSFTYDLPAGQNIDGTVSVTLFLDHLSIQ